MRVVEKAIFTRMMIELRDPMRQAVQQATGCAITDEYIDGPALKGKLACPEGVKPPASVAVSSVP